MASNFDKQKVTLADVEQNSSGPLAARQSSEQEFVKTAEELERKTKELIEANQRLLLLNQLSNSMILGDKPQEQLNAAFEAVAEELGAKYYFNYRTDENAPDTLFLESSRGLGPNESQAIRRIKFGQYLCGQVAQSRRPLIVENIHLLADAATAGVRAMGIKAYAGLPLVAHGHLFGTIAVGSTQQTRFTTSDIDFLKTVADQSAAMLDRSRLFESLREDEANLADFFENATMGLHWVGPDGIILRTNKVELELLGYLREEYVGRHIAEFHVSKEAIDDILTRLSRDEKLHNYEAQLRCKDGSVKTVRINSSGLWKDGKFVHSRCFTRDITEIKRSEDALLQNASLFSKLIEQAPAGVYVVDGQFRLQQVNALALPVFENVTPLIGRDFSEIICALWGTEIGGQIAKIFRHTLETGEPYVSPYFSAKRADSDVEQAFEWQIQRITLSDARYGVVCYFNDVTERRRTEEVLLQSEAKFRATFENAAVGIAHVAPDGTWLDVNHRLCEIVGYCRDEIIVKTFQDITHPDDLEADLDNVNKLIKGDADSYMMDKRYVRKDGSIVWAHLTVACVRNIDGKIKYFVSVIEDISDRKAAELALRESEARLRHAADAARLTYVEVDFADGRIRTAENFSTVMGYATPPDEAADTAVGPRLLLEHVVPNDRRRVEAALREFLTGSPAGKIAYGVLGDDQIERNIESLWSADLALDGRPQRVFATNHDITERKRAEDHIKLLMREVNHRSKNLLTVVQAVARQTARKSDPATFVALLSERIDGLAASQDLLVKNSWQGVDVATLVEAQLSHFKDPIGTRIVVYGPAANLTPPAAQGIGMALHELATNAAKYGALSNNSGRVTINWQVVANSPPEFQMTWIEEGGPPVQAPNHSGFGQMVIGRMAEAAVSGTAEIQYLESGFTWMLTAPVATTLEPNRSNQAERKNY